MITRWDVTQWLLDHPVLAAISVIVPIACFAISWFVARQ